MTKRILVNLFLAAVFIFSLWPVKVPAADPGTSIKQTSSGKAGAQALLWSIGLRGETTLNDGLAYPNTATAAANSSASNGVDSNDIDAIPDPPSPPFLQMFFFIDMNTGAPYGVDSRPASNTINWGPLVVNKRSNIVADNTKPVTVSWTLSGGIPASYSLTLRDDGQDGVASPAGLASINMRNASSYSYTNLKNTDRWFSITAVQNLPPSVMVIYPNGGETIGGTATVSAQASDDGTIASVAFQYSRDGGINWNDIGPATRTFGTSASGVWAASWNTLPVIEGSTFRVRAIAADNLGATGQDSSNANFTVSQGIWTASIIATMDGTLALPPGARAAFTDKIEIGVSAYASAGLDPLDIPDAPRPPAGGYLDSFFDIFGELYSRDVRPHLNPTMWPFTIANSGATGNITITRDISGVSASQAWIVLKDLTSQVVTDLRVSASYTYTPSASATRNFELYIKTNNAPSVQVTNPNGGSVSGVINVTADFTDPDSASPYNDGASSVIFEYASGTINASTAWNLIGPGANAGGNSWSASWNTLLVNEGANYKVKATGMDKKDASVSDLSDAVFSIIHTITSTGTFLKGWNMFALPSFPTATATFASELTDNGIASPLVYNYRTNTRIYGQEITWVPAVGYWIRAGSDTYWDIVGVPVTSAPFIHSLGNQAGWAQIGNPFNKPLPLSNVIVTYLGNRWTTDVAVSENAILPNLYSYAPNTRTYVQYNAMTPNTTILPVNTGFWIKTRVGGISLEMMPPS